MRNAKILTDPAFLLENCRCHTVLLRRKEFRDGFVMTVPDRPRFLGPH